MKSNTVLHILLVLLILTSCGARKAEKKRLKESLSTELVDKSETAKAEEIKVISETNVNRTTETTVNDLDETTTVKETIEPVDKTQKATYKDKYGNLQELNNAKKTTETTTKKNNTKTDISEKTAVTVKADSTSNKKESSKNDIKANSEANKATEDIKIDRKESIVLNVFFIAITIVIFLILIALYKKYKSKIS